MMRCKSRIVLCIPLVLKVNAFMGGCRNSIVSGDSCCVVRYCGVWGSFVACWVLAPRVRFQFFIVLVWFVCVWMCSWVGFGGA